jgi:hypothetical protein
MRVLSSPIYYFLFKKKRKEERELRMMNYHIKKFRIMFLCKGDYAKSIQIY